MTKARDLANAGTALGAVSATELAFVDGVTSAIQTQIDAKAPSSTAVTLTGTQTLTNKTLTNPVIASVVNNTLTSTTGDMIYASAANTPARLGIGSSAQVLTVASGIPSWATASSGGMTLLSTTTLTGASVTISSIDQTYQDLHIVISNPFRSNSFDSGPMRINPNGTNLLFTGTRIQGTNVEQVYLQGLNSPSLDTTSSPTTYIAFLQIRNYASSTNAKSCYFLASTQGTVYNLFGFLQTATAISSLVFTGNGNNMQYSGGTVQIYGVK